MKIFLRVWISIGDWCIKIMYQRNLWGGTYKIFHSIVFTWICYKDKDAMSQCCIWLNVWVNGVSRLNVFIRSVFPLLYIKVTMFLVTLLSLRLCIVCTRRICRSQCMLESCIPTIFSPRGKSILETVESCKHDNKSTFKPF